MSATDPAEKLPAELRGELARFLAMLPGVRVADARPGSAGAWIVDLVTDDGQPAGNIVLTPSGKEDNRQ